MDQPLDNQSTPLSRRTKLIYGSGDWGTSAATAALNAYRLFFLVNVVGLPAELAAITILVGRIWDAINDPFVGMLSDRLKTRWGRRRPFLLFGAIPFAVFFVLLWIVPPFDSNFALVGYYIAVSLLYDTMYTVINVPYSALTPELTPDYDERSSLAGWRIAVALLAALIAVSTFKLLAEDVIGAQLENTLGATTALRVGYAITAAVWGVTLAIPPLIIFVAIEEPKNVPVDSGKFRPVQMFKEVFSNRPFRLGAVIYLLSFAAVDVMLAVMVWFLVFYVQVEPGVDSLILGLALGVAFVTMPLTVKMMHRFGKRNSYLTAMTIFGVILILLGQVPPGGQYLVLIVALAGGLAIGAANVIPWAMVADVIEEDELHSGKRREGVYSGYMVFFRKLATAIAGAGAVAILGLAGFQEGTTGGSNIEQPQSALTALRILVAFVPLLMLIPAMIAAWRYPLDRETHEANLRELASRRAEQVEG